MTITATCSDCKREFTLTMSDEGYQRFKAGDLIQWALPELTASERELLISGLCEECFDKLFRD